MKSFAALLSATTFVCAVDAQGLLTPLGPRPDLGPAVIDRNFAGVAVRQIDQLELRPIVGSPGLYRVTCTAWLANGTGLSNDTSMLSGVLDMTTSPPMWTPNNHVDALNQACSAAQADEFQLTMSDDQLVVVWDNYCISPHTFACRRPNPTVPFASANIVPLALASPWTDTHLGLALPNGSYEVFFSRTGVRNIERAELDPTTGNLSNATTVRTRSPGAVSAHSPFVMRDSTGAARALSYGEIRTVGGAFASMHWAANVVDQGRALTIAQNPFFEAATGREWYSNGSTIGGTVVYGHAFMALFQQTVPYGGELTLLADTIPRVGSVRIAGWAPIRPAAPTPTLWSAVLIGPAAQQYSLPPVLGLLAVSPVLVTSALTMHDRFTGLAEWPLTAPAGLPMFAAQMVTLDLATGRLFASNLATF